MRFGVVVAVLVAVGVCLVTSGAEGALTCGPKCMERHERIKSLRDKSDSGMFRIDNALYKDLVMTKPRNYNTIFVLNALNPRRGCKVCRDAYEELKIVATSFYRAFPEEKDNWFFATVDMDGNEQIFKKLRQQSILMYYHVPPTGAPAQHSQQMVGAEEIVKYVTGLTGKKFPLHRPTNYFMMIVSTLALAMVGGVGYLVRDFLKKLMWESDLWAYLALAFVFLMMSGHMWLQIRGAPFMPNGGGMFSDTTQYMYGIESWVVIVLYAGITFGVIMINDFSRNAKSSTQSSMYLIAGTVITVFFFAYLVSCFAHKYRGYPFRFML
eukprot:m.164305 g.164305  ORF g.164305 m.164305 type:complete len:324 (-) comp13423_c0_seq10:3959-4930(-)